jgi:hypothetical protein
LRSGCRLRWEVGGAREARFCSAAERCLDAEEASRADWMQAMLEDDAALLRALRSLLMRAVRGAGLRALARAAADASVAAARGQG